MYYLYTLIRIEGAKASLFSEKHNNFNMPDFREKLKKIREYSRTDRASLPLSDPILTDSLSVETAV